MANTRKNAQNSMVIGYILAFIAHFFSYGQNTMIFNYGFGPSVSSASYTGWDTHPWYIFAPAMALVIYVFITRSPNIGWYVAAALFCLIFLSGNFLALIATALCVYAVWLKYKENKMTAKKQ